MYNYIVYSEIPIFQTSKGNKIGLKNWVFDKIGDRIIVINWWKGNNFWSELSGGLKS